MDPKVDRLSIWLQNKQLLQQINSNKNDIQLMQQDIIENVFDGFYNLLNVLLQNRYTMSTGKHKLFHMH